MGCSHSKANDQVIERVSVDTPAEEVPESVTASEPEVAIEAAPASAELPPAPASVPVEAVEEAPKSEEQTPVEEEAAAPVEEAVEAPTPAEEAPDEEAPVEEVPVEEVAPEEAEVEAEEAPVEAEAPKSEVAAEEAPKSEVSVEEEAPKSEVPVEEEAPKSETATEEVPAEEPKAEVVEAPASVAKPVDDKLTFKAESVTFNDKGVAFYHFDGSDASNPANDVHVSKRYSEFKALHAQLTQQLADNQAADLPSLPKASFLQGRKNKKMLEDRETQFTALLNAIAANPAAAHSDVFQAFLA